MFNFEVDTRGVPAPKTQGQQGFGVMTYTATLKYLMYNTGEKRDAYQGVCADVLLPMGDIQTPSKKQSFINLATH